MEPQQQPANSAAPQGEGEQQQPKNKATAARVNERGQVSQVATLLREGLPNNDGGAGDGATNGTGDEGQGTQEPGASSGDGKKPAPKTLAAIAETLGVKVEDLWAVEFRDGTNGEGETRTLGQLKDTLTKTTDLDTREFKFEERRVGAENELLRARQDLAYILSQLPASAVTPDMKAKAQKERERVTKVERARTLDAIEEWTDATIEAKEREAIEGHMSGYGFGRGDLDRITDHRWLKLLRDYWQQSERVRRAVAKAEEIQGKAAGGAAPSGQPRGAGNAAAPANVKQSAQKAQVTQIGKLLREGA